MRLRRKKTSLSDLENSKKILTKITLPKESVVEIGVGRGQMLCKMAQKNPNITYCGIEKVVGVILSGLKKATQLGLKNIFFVRGDAKDIEKIVSPKCREIWLAFPDPWPKRKHIKRRLTHQFYLKKYQKILGREGVLKFKTDVNELFEFTKKHLRLSRAKIIFETKNLHSSSKQTQNFTSNYEDKWTSEGKNIYYLEAKFTSSWNLKTNLLWLWHRLNSNKYDKI